VHLSAKSGCYANLMVLIPNNRLGRPLMTPGATHAAHLSRPKGLVPIRAFGHNVGIPTWGYPDAEGPFESGGTREVIRGRDLRGATFHGADLRGWRPPGLGTAGHRSKVVTGATSADLRSGPQTAPYLIANSYDLLDMRRDGRVCNEF
jgi:hypothetical protein